MRSYSVAALVLTMKPCQTNTQCYRVMQLRSVSIQQEGLKEEILTKIKSDIGEFSHLVTATESAAINCLSQIYWLSQFLAKKMQFFMCLVVSSSRLLFAFHVFSF